MSTDNITIDDGQNYYTEHKSKDYPVGVYYIDTTRMFMNKIRLNYHEEIEIDYIKEGNALFYIGEEKIEVSEGDAIIINSDRIHLAESKSEKCVILSVLFNPSYLFDSNTDFISNKYKEPVISNYDTPYYYFSNMTSTGRNVISIINDILKTNLDKKYGYELLTKGLLCNLWLTLLNIPTIKPDRSSILTMSDEDRVKSINNYIRKNYMREITLDEIAESIHLSKSECCRCFKRVTYMTLFEYLMRQRILEAAIKMQRQDKTVTSIAELADSVGFNNASYFNKIFKQYINETPKKAMEQIKRSHRDLFSPYGIPLSKM